MKFNLEKDYQLAHILHSHTQAAWKRRVKKLVSDGVDEETAWNTPVEPKDLKNAVEQLKWYLDEYEKISS